MKTHETALSKNELARHPRPRLSARSLRRGVTAASLPVLLSILACGSSSSGAGPAEGIGQVGEDLYGLGSIATPWPNGVVPVCFKDTTNNAALRAAIPTILGLSWSTYANITFTGFGACAGGNEVTIVFAAGTFGVTSTLGYGTPTVTLVSDDTSASQAHFKYEVIHELGHALGFAHEMKRPDNWPNGVALQCPAPPTADITQYQEESGGLYLTATYDSASIMNYCDPAGNLTTALSPGDIVGVSSSSGYGLPYLTPSPNTVTLVQGSTAGVDVSFLTQNLWAGPQGGSGTITPVSVSLTGLPTGVEALPLNTYGTQVNLVAFASSAVGTGLITAHGTGADGNGNVVTRTALLPVSIVAAPPGQAPPAPGCSLASTCSSEYFPAGYGSPTGYHTIETVSGVCGSPATSMQQLVNGSWVPLEAFVGNAQYWGTTTADVFDIGTQSALGATTSGAAVGSMQAVRACATTTGGTTCDPQSFVTIQDCCTPMTTCQADMCGTQSNGCGGEITCGGCASGQACVSGMCADTGAEGACESSGGTWTNGKCIKAPPPRCGGKLPACQ